MTTRYAWLATLGFAACLGAGCEQQLTGPSPTLPPPGGEPPVTTPSFACNEQLDQWIVVQGDKLSPLVVDTIDSEKDPSVVLPTLTLTRVATIEGQEEDGGEPVKLEATDTEDSPVKWIKAGEMRMRISPTLNLAPGIYDITATNANANASTSEKALGVLPRPTVTGAVPELMCVKQGAREVVVQGDHFLINGTELPAVTIGDATYAPTAAEECRSLGSIFGSYQVCKALRVTVPENDLVPTRHMITVSNLEPAACKSKPDEDDIGLTVVPPPSVAVVAPQPICGEQLDYDMMKVTGADFIRVDGAVPTVTVGDKTYTATAMDGCSAIPDLKVLSAERCTELTFAIPADDLKDAPGMDLSKALDLRVNNPDPAGCTSEQESTLTVVPPPTVNALEPNPVCLAQGQREVTVRGVGFLDVAGVLPQVDIGGQVLTPTSAVDCTDITTIPNVAVRSCEGVVVTVMQDALTAGEHATTVTNPDPAGCASTQTVNLVNVPPPTLTGASSGYTCVAGQEAKLSLTGMDFIRIGMELPSVTVGGVAAVTDAATGCMADTSGVGFERCTGLDITLAADSLMPGTHDIAVTNPGSTDCVSAPGVQIEIVAPATVTDVAPGLTCNDNGDTTFTVTGTDFVKVGNTLPSVVIDGNAYAANAATGCTAIANSSPASERCTGLTVVVPQDSVTPGPQDVEVRNPAPAACTSASGVDVLIAGPPVIAQAMPAQICDGGNFDGNLVLTGTNFLRVDGNAPVVTANGTPITSMLTSCTAVPDPNYTIEACTQMTINVPQALRTQSVTLAMTNPAPADCGASQLVLPLEVSPKITTVTPLRICTTGGTLQLDGTDFQQGMTVTIDSVSADSVTVNAAGTQAIATFTQTPQPGLVDLTATNPNMCDATFGTQVRVTSGPVVVYADPPVTYNQINTQVTLYVGALFGGSVASVVARDSAGTETALNISFDPARPNTVQAIIPAGLLPTGTTTDQLDFIVTDDIMCRGTGDDLVTATDTLTVAVKDIDPPFGWKDETTGVVVTAEETPAMGQVQFAATPRMYLNPSNAMMGDVATEIGSTLFNSATELGGIVPSGLPAGSYDLIVVNPDGSVGVKTGAFTVTTNPPPKVDTVTPGSWATGQTALVVSIAGSDFDDPTVTGECKDPGGQFDIPTFTRTAFTATSIDVTVNTSTLDHLSTCVITVTNTDGSYVLYSPVTVTNPAGKFVEFKAGPDMLVERRAHAMSSGAPSRTARYIYAFGGDDGTAANTKVSTEAASINRFGEPVSWFALPNDLPAGRAFAESERVGDFVYLVGGHDGTAAQNTVWRALVLDPLFTPKVTNVEFDINPEFMGGMATGVYYYRIAAVMAAGDAANPGGETLASNPQAVRIPVGGIELVLNWSAIPGAAEYRVYRSSAPDQPFGTEELLATVPATATTFRDDGTGMTTGGTAPLALGSLGKWHNVATLTTARYHHGLATAQDPSDATKHYLYAIGGRNDAGLALGDYEYVTITVNGPRDQTVKATTDTSASILTVPRYSAAALTGSPANANYLSNTYIYMLGGKNAVGTEDRGVDVAQVQAGGALSTWTDVGNMQRSRSGYGAAIANNNLVTAGGQGGSPSNTADKGEFCGPSSMCTAPDVDKWSSLSNVNMADRYQLGDVSFGGFLYMSGGLGGAMTPTKTVDFSPLGGTP